MTDHTDDPTSEPNEPTSEAPSAEEETGREQSASGPEPGGGSEPSSDQTDSTNQSHRRRPQMDDMDWEGSREDRERARAKRRGRSRHRGERKGRVLHTRISEQLSEDIRRLAEDMRVPTSNLVRNVLEEVFHVVESVSDDVSEVLEDVFEEAQDARERIRSRGQHRWHSGSRGRRSRHRSWSDVAEEEINRDERRDATRTERPAREEPAPPPRRERPVFDDVIGWQPLVLNVTQDCADCSRTIRRGSRAFVGIGESGLTRTTLCRDCLQDR